MKRNRYKVKVEATVQYSVYVSASDVDNACEIAEVLYDQGYLRPDTCTRCNSLEFVGTPTFKNVTRAMDL